MRKETFFSHIVIRPIIHFDINQVSQDFINKSSVNDKFIILFVVTTGKEIMNMSHIIASQLTLRVFHQHWCCLSKNERVCRRSKSHTVVYKAHILNCIQIINRHTSS